MLNASPHKEGCTYTALKEIGNEFEKQGTEYEIFHIGNNPIASCRACGACSKIGKCIINDTVNEFIEKAQNADGFIFGSPVHYASASGAAASFLDRAFYASARSGKNVFRHKPGAAIVSARRAGTTAALDQLNKYFMITEMPVISSRYWNMVHGSNPEDVKKDLEGMQIMRILAKNFVWYLKMEEAAKKAGINPPEREEVVFTNFIR
ncbi:MAG: flavodoxin family protein [bacterium]|nr:flavodoxin family protein [bacterium]